MIRLAREEAQRLQRDAQKEIESEKNKAINELREQVGAISLMIATKVLERQVDETLQQQIVDQYLKEVGQGYEQ
jgi:F-type H+-transporting ATPase subunit b